MTEEDDKQFRVAGVVGSIDNLSEPTAEDSLSLYVVLNAFKDNSNVKGNHGVARVKRQENRWVVHAALAASVSEDNTLTVIGQALKAWYDENQARDEGDRNATFNSGGFDVFADPVKALEDENEKPEDENSETLDRRMFNPNVTQTRPVTKPLDKTKGEPADYLGVLSYTAKELNKVVGGIERRLRDYSDDLGPWVEAITEGEDLLVTGGALEASLDREDSDWGQRVEYEGQGLAAGKPRFGGGGGKLTGERAVLKVSSMLGLGELIQIPLWHSGIWLSLKTPSHGALLELQRRIAAEKVALGRQTNGLLYSNNSVYIVSHLVNFIIQHVYDSNLKDQSADNLKRHIRCPDIPIMAWGIANTIWTNGWPLRHPCVASPEECTHVEEALLDIGKLCWTDSQSLTESQKKHMVRRGDKFDNAAIEAYQEEFIDSNEYAVHRVSRGGDDQEIRMVFKTPSIRDYEQSGFDWVDGMVRLTDEAFDVPLRGEERQNYIQQQALLTLMHQYSHWVKKLVITSPDEDEETIEDRSTLDGILASLSKDQDLVDEYLESVGKYIDQITVSLIALPRFNCPVCERDQGTDAGPHPHLIPQDPVRLFFTLRDRQLYKALSQEK